MNVKRAARTVILTALGLGAMVAVVVAALGTTTVVEVETGTFDPAKITDMPLVVAKSESGGFGMFGIQFDAPDRWVSVGLAPSPECLRSDEDGTEFLDGGEGCEPYADLEGVVSGGGTRADGTRWVEMRRDVDRDCFEASTIGDLWPAPDCVS